MKQKELIISYVKEKGSIVPAKIAGEVYQGCMFGSETSKRCRELRVQGVLCSAPEGRFERFSFSQWYQESIRPKVYGPMTQEELVVAKQNSLFQ